jgi:hypothetical protein
MINCEKNELFGFVGTLHDMNNLDSDMMAAKILTFQMSPLIGYMPPLENGHLSLG